MGLIQQDDQVGPSEERKKDRLIGFSGIRKRDKYWFTRQSRCRFLRTDS